VIARIRDEMHVELDLRQFFDAEPTIARMAEQIEALRRGGAKEEAGGWSCLVPIQPAGARPPLFCIHWAGGHVVIYRDLARHLGPDQPVYGLQALGIDGRRAPHTRLEDMAAHYVQEVRRLQPFGPYHLAGASMGGKIAFEMAHQIMEQGERVGLLALIDTTGDVERPPLPIGERVHLHSTNVRRLGPGYLVHRARVRLRRWVYGWVIRMGWPLPRFMRNLKGISYIAARNYHPRSYPGKVTLFRAAERPRGGTREFFLGWDRVAGGGMEVYEIPGTHVSLMLEPGVRLLAQELRRCLDREREERPGP
jgi:thioesterase domain-containing protein